MSAQLLLAPDDADWGQGLSVAFDSGGGGHAVLLLRAGTFPTLLDQDFTFSAQEYVQGPQARPCYHGKLQRHEVEGIGM